MSEVKVKESTFQAHATQLSNDVAGQSYDSRSCGHMAYSNGNAVQDLQEAIVSSVDAMKDLVILVRKDAYRLEQMGQAYANQDQEVGQGIEKLGDR
ncbi:DUF3130 family protein [Listeria costaricensis]|uniref:DUF3130 family protein n=1 Tax=Listeria costaricensis TaxID=2026604 RepID=UPI000C0818A1|nr:DUF3130 family protein [Listeria costaricensis]